MSEGQRPEDPAVVADVGPDPVYPLSVAILGLLVMALGGAFTWHWVFNIGEALLVLGGLVFLLAMARTSLKLQPVEAFDAARRWWQSRRK